MKKIIPTTYITILSFLFILCLGSHLEVQAKPLKLVKNDGSFIGGIAPRIAAMPVTKEFKKNGKIFYKVKAVVNRASGDTNGKMILVSAKGTVLESLVNFFIPKTPLKKIPPLRAKFNYNIFVSTKGLNSGVSRRAKGKKRFVEPIEFGLQPDTYRVILGVCTELDDHPVTTAVKINGALDFLAKLPKFFTPSGIATAFFKLAVFEGITCSGRHYDYEVLAKVPNLRGKSLSKATELLEERNLKILELDPLPKKQCGGVKSGKVARQGVLPGKRRSAGSFVSYRLCKAKTTSAGVLNGLFQDSLSNIIFNFKSEGGVVNGYIQGNLAKAFKDLGLTIGQKYFRNLKPQGKNFVGERTFLNSSTLKFIWGAGTFTKSGKNFKLGSSTFKKL